MRKTLTVLLAVCVVGSALAGDKTKVQTYRLDKSRKIAVVGDEVGPIYPELKPKRASTTNAIGPGTPLMDSFYDYGSNGGVLNNIVLNDDGTIAVGRMGAMIETGTPDRGTWFSYFDGTSWTAMTKVEAVRRGWSSIDVLADGNNVTVSHIANEVNVDAAPGLGIWTSTITGFVGAAQNLWMRLTVDGKDNIIIASTVNATVNGVGLVKAVAISRDGGTNWTHQYLWPDTVTYKPALGADDQAIASWGDKVAVAVAADGDNRDVHLWQSGDNGATWTYQNLTNNPQYAPAGTTIDYPAGDCDAIYDNAGQLHVFWGTYLGQSDSSLSYSTSAGIYHWSAAAGITEIADFSDIPGSALDVNIFTGGSAFDQTNIDGDILNQPQATVDADNNLYLLFCSFRPNDFDADSAHYTDVYAVGSNDGGKSWGAVVNVTDSPQSEDNWASVARRVDDNIHFVYSSDGSTGNSVQGGGVGPTTYLYHNFPKANVPFGTGVDDRPGAEIPSAFALHPAYPNPFNPSTQIAFDLTKSVRVKLSVYDVSGKLVATLVNGKLDAGKHSVSWNAQGQPSGVYFAKLEAEGLSQVQKVTLVK